MLNKTGHKSGYTCLFFSPFPPRDFWFASLHATLFWKKVYSIRKEFAPSGGKFTPSGSKFIPNRVDPLSRGNKTILTELSSIEVNQFPLKQDKSLCYYTMKYGNHSVCSLSESFTPIHFTFTSFSGLQIKSLRKTRFSYISPESNILQFFGIPWINQLQRDSKIYDFLMKYENLSPFSKAKVLVYHKPEILLSVKPVSHV